MFNVLLIGSCVYKFVFSLYVLWEFVPKLLL